MNKAMAVEAGVGSYNEIIKSMASRRKKWRLAAMAKMKAMIIIGVNGENI
jgi:hypothetical protein